jgi:ABC-type sugar transport system ATPase subunit
MSILTLKQVCKVYAGGVSAAQDVSFEVPTGAFCVLLGPSGCGKSTTLRMVAGLETVSRGSILIDGVVINAKQPKDRDIAMVFQNYALYPHLTVAENIAFPLSMRGVPRREAAPRVARAAEIMQLSELMERRPAQLSGGQRQRVAVARAIVREPKVFLFDEPLSNLDARMRMQTRNELRALHQRLRITSLYVTHDQEEALSLADMIVVMAGGRVRQVGSPMEVFDAPADRFVAGFVGTPAMNFMEATAVASSEGGGSIVLQSEGLGVRTQLTGVRVGDRYTLGVRPSSVMIGSARDPSSAAGLWNATVVGVEYLGDVMDVSVRVGQIELLSRSAARRSLCVGDLVRVAFDASDVHVFEVGADGRSIGRAVSLSGVLGDPQSMHSGPRPAATSMT